ncbi:MAG: family 78 glycoside hydrolase catalytic domain [Clostridia bacterium]|nr:family 78 glycoside hydrolase catalytic domain [Clostridia bacterium]
MKATRLRTEYLRDPIGVDFEKPRLMWNCEDGIKQTAYQIVTDKWDSGKVTSRSMYAEYPEKLRDRERVAWRVRLWDENGEAGGWEEAFFEVGISEWRAKWITGNYSVKKRERYPVDCFRRVFEVKKPIVRARLYITACGLYEAKIGGKRVGDFVLAPGHTDYRKRVQYQTYDVTDLISDGENEITVQLADGWYRGSCGAWGRTNQYGSETKLLAQLELYYEDGSSDTVPTDENWGWSADGPIRFADNKDGEVVEAFRTPLYGGRTKVTAHSVRPTASNNVPVTEHERFHPVITTAPNGKKLLDFGQNLAGYVSFSVRAHVGQTMRWRFGEMLDRDGNLTLENVELRMKNKVTPLQRIDYTCAEGKNEYKTTFAVFGFRYAEVDTEVELTSENVESIAVYSDMEETGSFESSNPLLDRLVSATRWSTKSNSLDVPTDCPTRERHGWTGDAQIFFGTASFLFDYAAFSKKYLRDVFDWQKKNGKLPQIAPYGGVDFYMNTLNGSVGWSDVGIIMPYRFARKYGDDRILGEYYDGMKKYAEFMISRIGKNGFMSKNLGLKAEAKKNAVNSGQSYGEWAEPADVHPNDWRDMVAPHPEVSTAYTAYVLGLMAEIARKTGHADDEERYRSFSDGCRAAYQALVGTPRFSLDTDRQARQVRPLSFGLLTDEQTAFAEKRLIKALDNYGWRLGTGFLSTPLILGVLEKIDVEAAYRLLENEEIPGWLSMPKNGATTIWESWEGDRAQNGIGSLNHYSKGAVVEWLFARMCGIGLDGENRFVIEPRPGGHFTRASARYASVYGVIESGWEKTDGGYVYTVTVPVNCEAEIRLPGGKRETVGAGEHVFTEDFR